MIVLGLLRLIQSAKLTERQLVVKHCGQCQSNQDLPMKVQCSVAQPKVGLYYANVTMNIKPSILSDLKGYKCMYILLYLSFLI